MKLISISITDGITTVASFPFISSPVVVAVISLAYAVQDMPSPEMI
jgi:hypothetical protein